MIILTRIYTHDTISTHMPQHTRGKASQPQTLHDHENIKTELEQSGGLVQLIEKVKNEYACILSSTQEIERESQFPTGHDWEMLAILYDYDKETAQHSVEVFHLTREKIDKEMASWIILSEGFPSDSGISRDCFLRACLFHDIGKLTVPKEVLTNHLSDIECAWILYENKEQARELLHKKGIVEDIFSNLTSHGFIKKILQALHTKNLRPQSIIHLNMMIPSDKIDTVNKKLKPYGLTADNTLLEIMSMHEGASFQILTSMGFAKEAELAGSHHSRNRNSTNTIKVGSPPMTVNLSDIIHLADVEQAMGSKRYYKTQESQLAVLSSLVDHAERGFVSKEITRLWVSDELHTLQENKTYRTAISGADATHLEHILTFLKQEKSE